MCPTVLLAHQDKVPRQGQRSPKTQRQVTRGNDDDDGSVYYELRRRSAATARLDPFSSPPLCTPVTMPIHKFSRFFYVLKRSELI
jgi:hypothetical protein